MSFKIDGYSTNKNAEISGVWVALKGGNKIMIARAGGGNKAYQKSLRDVFRKYADYTNGKKEVPEHIEEKIEAEIRESVARHIIKDWKVTSGGKEIPFSTEKAIEALADDDDLYADVMEAARERATFTDIEEQEAIKNSRKPSAGN